jgi:hypothetical protein
MFDDPPTNEDGVVELLSDPLDEHRLNEAKWAACNHRYYGSLPPTMEEASALALKVVCTYLGLSPEEWIESGGEPFDPLTEQLVAGSVSTSQSS